MQGGMIDQGVSASVYSLTDIVSDFERNGFSYWFEKFLILSMVGNPWPSNDFTT